ncbi:MAG: 50S ribosomal protein L30e [Desulfurococcaceae archaeon]|jgi:large subunit ribosomal protein L30e|nr:50S ribosomal protein L30e [Desulfurococcaceae archaeon]MCC6057466.1 50S ribosomal protein L30e [Desulfurococcaceae archaeon]
MSLDTVLKFVVRTGKVIVGARKTLKMLKLGKIKYIVIASNIPDELRQDIEYYAKLSNVKVIRFPGTNKDLGTVIGKLFGVAVLGIQDPGQVPYEVLDKLG